jgi:hypothetical protein
MQHEVVAASEDKMAALPARSQAAIRFLLPLVIFCWPIVYLFNHVFPINGQYMATGNDFIILYYKYKVYLLAHLANFSFPLWSPSEGAGFPFYTSPFTQTFYPLNLPLAVWYKISGGYNPLDHQVFTVLGISIFAVGLFIWLRQVNTNLRAVVFGVLVMSVSFKITEILRFPNAVHTAAWYPWVLYALTRIMLSRSLKSTIVGGILLTLFVICLCTGGYPYYVYYSQFLFVPYMLIFLVKPLRLRLFGAQAIQWRRAFGTLIVALVAAILICTPYLLGIKHLMAETTDRTGKNFGYSTSHVFNLEDTVGSLVYPPAAQAEGWYFFSITGVLIILLYLLSGRTTAHNREETGNSKKVMLIPPNPRDLWLKLFFIIWIGTISYISHGRYSHLFILLWKFMPGFSNLRVWGRLNIILVPIFAWLLSTAYMSFESMISGKDVSDIRKRRQAFTLIVKMVVVYAVILGVQLYLYLNKIYDYYWLRHFEDVSSQDVKFIIYGAVAFFAIFSSVVLSKWIRPKSGRSLAAVLAVLVLVATLEMRHVGIRMWPNHGEPCNALWAEKTRIHLDVAKLNEASFNYPRRASYPQSISLEPSFNVGVMESWYFSRYIRFLKKTKEEMEAQRILLGMKDGTKIFFSESIEHDTIRSFLRDADRYWHPGHLVSYTGDELRWEIHAPVEGYLSFIDNWDRNWKVFVDDKPADMELLFGTFKSVRLTPGQHNVRFDYQPALF